MIKCLVTNEVAQMEVEVDLSEGTLDYLFGKSERREIPEKYVDYLNDEMHNTFFTIASFLEIEPKEFIKTTLQVMLFEDPAASFIEEDLDKPVFLTTIKEYMSIVEAPELPVNEFSPDIILYVMTLYLYHKVGGNETTFEVPEKVIPLILNILSAKPDTPPEDFDPSKPYYVDEKKQEAEILKQFPFFKNNK